MPFRPLHTELLNTVPIHHISNLGFRVGDLWLRVRDLGLGLTCKVKDLGLGFKRVRVKA